MEPVKRTGQINDRHDPTSLYDYLSQQHVERYAFARSLLKPEQVVLDVACGSGYGTEMLKEHGCRVVAGDLDADELGRVASQKSITNLVTLDALNLPFPDSAFDAVVSFETVEHVFDGKTFLEEMQRVLKPGGLFISSTPNIKYTFHPAYHLKEYKPKEYYKLVSGVFGNVTQYGQYYKMKDNINDNIRWAFENFLRNFPLAKRLPKPIKSTLSRLRAKTHSPRSQSPSKSVDNNYYSVRHYASSRLLRIMVTVSTR